ncbi:hypothetical protein B0T24DRAFT_583425 [Lasiosphaeria ovina]|uniref:Uncharacterized protein n=1 Tax=Lasiosphaeria ovina TaxID=92902 RepID=A0AAE0N0C0_9PEZI|nr:hypothetical protein B0T24DRAFT_583425 [Lasiosphaeria ovina]
MAYTDVITTTFRPDPSCFASSNLWLNVLTGTYACKQYYEPFSTGLPAVDMAGRGCLYTFLGPATWDGIDSACHQEYGKETVYSDCPSGMTVASESTQPWLDDISLAVTACCPTAFDFGPPGAVAAGTPTVIDGTTYAVNLMFTELLCKATSVKALSDQTVTLTVATTSLAAVEVAWDYEHGFVAAEPAHIYKFLYPDPQNSGSTSTCFGFYCPTLTNPLKPTPTPTQAPTGTYVTPPPAVVTQFTPPASCAVDAAHLWLVSTGCYLTGVDASVDYHPPWLLCTITVAGDPVAYNVGCYPQRSAVPYSGCPVGHTVAKSGTWRPFDTVVYNDYVGTTSSFDVVGSGFTCCPAFAPTAPSDKQAAFTYYSDIHLFTTTHNNQAYSVYMVYPMPFCAASSLDRQLGGSTVTLGLYVDTQVWDKRRRDDETSIVTAGTSTYHSSSPTSTTVVVWDGAHDTVFAHSAQFSYTVFHGTYTCFENCDNYFTYSYYNTDPNAPSITGVSTTLTGTSTGTGGGEGQQGAAANSTISLAMAAGGREPAGLSVTAVVVLAVQVVMVEGLRGLGVV